MKKIHILGLMLTSYIGFFNIGCNVSTNSSNDSNPTNNSNTSNITKSCTIDEDSFNNFKNSLNFEPVPIDFSTVIDKKFIIPQNDPIYFTKDYKFYSGGEGEYNISDNILVFCDNNKAVYYMAFQDLTNDSGDYTAYSINDDKTETGSLQIEEFNETNFNPYPSYVNNGQKITLDVDDDYLVQNEQGYIQVNIKDDNDNGVQCTTNYISYEDFKNAFSNNELILDSNNNEVNCRLFSSDYPNPTTQTEVIKFIDNQDGSYQIHMISGYFSGDDYNITAIDSDLLSVEQNSHKEDNGTLVTDLVHGKVTFYDENGNITDIPQNAKVRITPEIYQVNGNWRGVNCKIENDGTFGDECYIDVNEADMRNALENNVSQIVVYDDVDNDFHWEADENSYFEENKHIDDLNDINISVNE